MPLIRCASLVLLLGLAGCAGTIGAFSSTVTINADRGGYITRYIAKYQRWRADNRKVIIDGYCASSCTTFIAIIPRGNVCVTRKAVLGFHGAYAATMFGKQELPGQTHLMLDQYNDDIRAWLDSRGGLRTYKTMILMKWPTTGSYFNVCQNKA